MKQNNNNSDTNAMYKALGTVVNKFDTETKMITIKKHPVLDVKKFKQTIEKSRYFPTEELQTYPVPVTVSYLRATNRFILGIKLVEIQELFHDIVFKNNGFDTEYEDVYALFLEFKKMLSGQIGVAEKQLYPYSQFVYEIDDDNTDFDEYIERSKKFCIENFEDEHGTDTQILLARVIYLLKKHILLE
jgi:hypothetical protein